MTLDDIATANRLAHEVLGRSLDELPPQTRRLLLLIDEMVEGECERLKMERSDYRFSRRDVRAWTPAGATRSAEEHLARLEELEYLLVHHGGRGQSFVYELLFDGQGEDGKPCCRADRCRKARAGATTETVAAKEEKSRPSRPQVAGVSRGGRPHETRMNTGRKWRFSRRTAKTALIPGRREDSRRSRSAWSVR